MNNLLSTLYPVGSIYIGTQHSCPLATLIAGSQWNIVSNGRALWGGNGSNANSTIEAGLPNITGTFGATRAIGYDSASGAVSQSSNLVDSGSGSGRYGRIFTINASHSSSIYGNSNTVQPPAYIVNVWRRTA